MAVKEMISVHLGKKNKPKKDQLKNLNTYLNKLPRKIPFSLLLTWKMSQHKSIFPIPFFGDSQKGLKMHTELVLPRRRKGLEGCRQWR